MHGNVMRIGIQTEIVKKKGHIITVLSRKGLPIPVLLVYDKESEKIYGMEAVCAHFGCGVITNMSKKAPTFREETNCEILMHS